MMMMMTTTMIMTITHTYKAATVLVVVSTHHPHNDPIQSNPFRSYPAFDADVVFVVVVLVPRRFVGTVPAFNADAV